MRVFRISFSGELSFEVATPAALRPRPLGRAARPPAREFGIDAYGTEALHVLRAEKGFIVVGDETDGTVTPHDVGLDWPVSKKKRDFIGKRSLEQPHLSAPRPQAARRASHRGSRTRAARRRPCGARRKAKPPMATIGHVTSSYFSPTLDRSIAMALIENGRARMGETLSFPLERRQAWSIGQDYRSRLL